MPRKQDLSAQRLRKHIEVETNPLAHALNLVNEAALQGAAYKAAQTFRELIGMMSHGGRARRITRLVLMISISR